MPAGRPSKFTPAIVDAICTRIAEGESLSRICTDAEMPAKRTVMDWLDDSKNSDFRTKYARAREAQADFYAAEIIDISDDSERDTYTDEDGNVRTNQEVVARSRLRVDSRKWYASKLAPKKYGERLELAGDQENPIKAEIDIVDVAKRIAFVLAMAEDKV